VTTEPDPTGLRLPGLFISARITMTITQTQAETLFFKGNYANKAA